MGTYTGGIYGGKEEWELMGEFEGDFKAGRRGRTVVEEVRGKKKKGRRGIGQEGEEAEGRMEKCKQSMMSAC